MLGYRSRVDKSSFKNSVLICSVQMTVLITETKPKQEIRRQLKDSASQFFFLKPISHSVQKTTTLTQPNCKTFQVQARKRMPDISKPADIKKEEGRC